MRRIPTFAGLITAVLSAAIFSRLHRRTQRSKTRSTPAAPHLVNRHVITETPMKTHPAIRVLVSSLSLVASSVLAQEVAVIDQTVDATCTAFLAPVLGRKDIAQLAIERTIDSRIVCSCARTKTRADERLAEYLSMDAATLSQRTDDVRIRAYVLGRVLQSVLSCFSAELDSTLGASTALK